MSDPWLHITFFVKKSSFAPSSLSPVWEKLIENTLSLRDVKDSK
jgi:hypothetical protein